MIWEASLMASGKKSLQDVLIAVDILRI